MNVCNIHGCVYIYIYVCVCVCVCVCMYVYTHTHTHIYIYTWPLPGVMRKETVNDCVIFICMYTNICLCMYASICVCMCTFMHVYMHVFAYVCVYLCMHACMHACIYVYVLHAQVICVYACFCLSYISMYRIVYVYAIVCPAYSYTQTRIGKHTTYSIQTDVYTYLHAYTSLHVSPFADTERKDGGPSGHAYAVQKASPCS